MMKNNRKQKILIFLLSLLLLVAPSGIKASQTDETKDYRLEEVVVLSRHNIRAPLSTKGSALDKATPHEWFSWSSNASELSLRGGMLETAMGQYFRKWLEAEGLFEENFRPDDDEVRFYANGKQRTIATANYFASGLLPVANITVETHAEYDKMDPVFTPKLTFISDEYVKDATKQMEELIPKLQDSYDLLMDTLDFEDADGYKNGEVAKLQDGDVTIDLQLDAEPSLKGSLKTGTSLADALVLQYYEESDPVQAAFGHELTDEDWLAISKIKDVYGDVLFTAPLVASNVAHPLLEVIDEELENEDRLFTFLCGHDSNVGSVLSALGVREYELEGAIEKTPIGCKLVFEKWADENDEEYVRVRLVYNTVDQLRDIGLTTLEDPPGSHVFNIAGLKANEDGMYRYEDFDAYLDAAIERYDQLRAEYDPAGYVPPKTGIE